MKIYVIDVSDMKDYVSAENVHPMDDGEETLPEMLWLHKDLIRGCTNNYMTMRMYYDDMQRVVGKYVELVVHEYEILTSYDLPSDLPRHLKDIDLSDEETIDDDTLSALGLTLYNSPERNVGSNRCYTAAHMPVLIRYPLEKGGWYVVNSAAQEVFNDIYFTECEYEILFRIARLFICLKKYVKPLIEDIDLLIMYRVLESEFSRLPFDFYDPDLRWHLDPIALNKVYIDSLDVFKR